MIQVSKTTFISAPHKRTIFILELARKGCRKLVCSAMPEVVSGRCLPSDVDHLVELRAVPLGIRTAARLHLGVEARS